jgi:SAM-dependent methyltransferase
MNIEHVQFPAMLPQTPWRRRMKVLLGRLLSVLDPRAAAAVAAGQLPSRLGLREQLLIAALVDRHQRAGTLGELAPLHAWLWQGEQAVSFHEQAAARFNSWWLRHHCEIVAPIQKLIDAPDSPYRQLCEIGCGSGLVLRDLARRLPQLDRLTGLDLSALQTERNRMRQADPRIRFVSGDVTAWIPAHATPGTIFLTVAGVLEYLPRAQVQRLFRDIATKQAPAAVALIEPVPRDYDFERESESRPYGAENSLAHNYPLLLRETGFVTHFQQLQNIGDFTFMLLLAERGHSSEPAQA